MGSLPLNEAQPEDKGRSSTPKGGTDPLGLTLPSPSANQTTSEMVLFLNNSVETSLNDTGLGLGFGYNLTTNLSFSLVEGFSAGTNSGSWEIDLNASLEGNLTDSLPWWDNWDNVPYPGSGYTQLGIVALAFFITCIMILIVVGNLLVCIAISTEKSLKTVQNWFIASLAVSDLCLGLVVMPFSLAYELMGYWIFGQLWCDIHRALDVLLCTASINNLCLISLDRYWSVTQAVEYLKKRTPSRAMFMITFVWIFSACVSLPPLVGWKGKEEEGQCSLSEDLGYVLYSANGSFYVPAVVMVFVYARIFVAARSRARRHVKKKQKTPHVPIDPVTNDPAKDKSTTTTTCTSLSNPSPPDQNKEESCESAGEKSSIPTPGTPATPSQPRITFASTPSPTSILKNSNVNREPPASPQPLEQPRARSEESPVSLTALSPPPQIVIEGSETPHSSPTKICDKTEPGGEMCVPQTHKPSSLKRPKLTIDIGDSGCGAGPFLPSALKQNGATIETRFISADDDSDAVESPISKTSGLVVEAKTFLATPKLSKSPSYGSALSIADFDDSDLCNESDADKKKKKKGKVQYQNPPVTTISTPNRHTPSDAERHKRKIAKARERRATIILGLIMASFISAWLPFFVMYLLQGICKACTVPSGVFTFAFWMGYCNSAINPIIYTVFNRDFKKAFRKILFR